jgi:hypothetical protein
LKEEMKEKRDIPRKKEVQKADVHRRVKTVIK